MHLGNEGRKHPVSLHRLPLQVFHDAMPALGRDDVHDDGARLSEPPAAPNCLIVGLKRMRREKGHVGAVLPVETPCADLWLGDQHPYLAMTEGVKGGFFVLVIVGSAHLSSVRN